MVVLERYLSGKMLICLNRESGDVWRVGREVYALDRRNMQADRPISFDFGRAVFLRLWTLVSSIVVKIEYPMICKKRVVTVVAN